MLEELDMEKLVEKAGGPFVLTVLVQKRLKELQEGAPSLVDRKNKSIIEVVCQEIIEDKIKLVPEDEAEENQEDNIQDIF